MFGVYGYNAYYYLNFDLMYHSAFGVTVYYVSQGIYFDLQHPSLYDVYGYNAFHDLNSDLIYDSAFDVKLYFVIQDINFDL